jgi:monofunctional biosynthetic peptidoglycan transglycosylase
MSHSISIKLIAKRFLKILMWCAISFFGSTMLAAIVYKWVPVGYTPLMLIRSAEYCDDDSFLTQKKWVSIEHISPYMVQAAIAAEDNNFMKHNGFDWTAIERAIEHNKTSNRTQGASTISQQAAKNVFLWPQRSYLRKGLEVYFTFLIETFWSKERIMEVYLNVIETGKGVYGVEAAAQKFFKKPAAKLTRGEAAMIAITLPNPLHRNINNPSRYMYKRQSDILRLMEKIGPVDLQGTTSK